MLKTLKLLAHVSGALRNKPGQQFGRTPEWFAGRTVHRNETVWIEKNLEQCSDYNSRWSWFSAWHRGRYFNLSLFWWSLAETLGHDYTCGVGRAVNNPEGEANLEVSVEQFESALEQLTATATTTPESRSLTKT